MSGAPEFRIIAATSFSQRPWADQSSQAYLSPSPRRSCSSFLSFLELGLPSPMPSWARWLNDGYHGLDFAPHIALAPTIALSITLMGYNWLGDGLRDALRPADER